MRKPAYEVVQTTRPPSGSARRAIEQDERRGGERRADHRARRATEQARQHRGRRQPVDPALDHADDAGERTAEEPAEHVTQQAAEHPGDAVDGGPFGREVATDPEPGRGEEHDQEQTNDLDEHLAPFTPFDRPRGAAA